MPLSEHLEKLRHFRQLSNYRSLREGAQGMGISQAGLSKSIAALEEILDTQLFVRSRDGLRITQEGSEALASADRILKEASDLETRLRKMKVSLPPRTLEIGMYDSIAVYFFEELQSYIGRLYPDLRLQMTVDTSRSLAGLVREGKIDLAIGVNFDREKDSNVEFFKLFDDHYSFYVSNRHELIIDKLPLLIHGRAEDSGGKALENHLGIVRTKQVVHRVFNFETLKALTQQGVGIGVLPTQVAKPLVKRGNLTPVQIPKAKHLFGAHNIGFLATKNFLNLHRPFAEDIYRLGGLWSKS